MDTFPDISFSAPVDSQSPDLLMSVGLLLEETVEDGPSVEHGKRGRSEEQDLADEPARKKGKPNPADELDDVGPREPPAPVLPSIDLGAGRSASCDETYLELLYDKLDIVVGRYNPSYLKAGIFFDISPESPKDSSLPAGTFTVFIVLKPPFPHERIPHRLRALEHIDKKLGRALWHDAWRPQKMVYYVLDEERTETGDPDGKYTGGYWAEARRPLGGPRSFDYRGALARTENAFPTAPWRRRTDEASQKDGPVPPDWTQVRFDTDTKFVLGGHPTTRRKEAQPPPPPKRAFALKLGAGHATGRKPKQDSLRKKVVTKRTQGL